MFVQRSRIQNQHRNHKLWLRDVCSGWSQTSKFNLEKPSTLQWLQYFSHTHLSPSTWEQKVKKETKCLWLVQDHTGRQEKTEQHSSSLPSSVSWIKLLSFAPCCGSAWEEHRHWWPERQSKGNPVDTAADYRGKIPKLQLFVMFHAETMRWERRREKMYRSSVSSAWTKVTHYFTSWLSYKNTKI